MGGYGSGRRWQSGKATTSDMRPLDIRRLQRDGLLKAGQSFIWQWTINSEVVARIRIRAESDLVMLNYRYRKNGCEWHQLDYGVGLEWTDLHYGGQRPWFLCPISGCGRRVAILYGGLVFACRHCQELAYACQRESDDDRAMRRAETIRQRLGWEPGIANPNGGKPKGMHWTTFERLQAEHDAFARASWTRISALLARVGGWKGVGLEPPMLLEDETYQFLHHRE